jgi:hypothetical protein
LHFDPLETVSGNCRPFTARTTIVSNFTSTDNQ